MVEQNGFTWIDLGLGLGFWLSDWYSNSFRHVLTAAYCVHDKNLDREGNLTFVEPKNIEIRAGAHDIRTNIEGRDVILKVEKVIIHPEYTVKSFVDAAILLIQEEITFTKE